MGRKIKSIEGERVGSLIAYRPTEQRDKGFAVWDWKCVFCGNIITGTYYQVSRTKDNPSGKYHCKCDASTRDLISGNTHDIKGTQIGHLVAVAPTLKRYEPSGSVIWVWKCLNCGATITGTYRQIQRSREYGKYRCKCDRHPIVNISMPSQDDE